MQQRRAFSLKGSSTPKPASSGSGIGSAVAGGAASAAVGNLLTKLEGLFGFKRDEFNEFTERDIKDTIASLSPEDQKTVHDALVAKIGTLHDSDLSARAFSLKGAGSGIGGAVAGGAASAVVGNLLNEIESLFRRDDVLEARAFSLKPSSAPKPASSGSGIGSAVAGGAASAAVGNLLTKLEGLFGFKRDEYVSFPRFLRYSTS